MYGYDKVKDLKPENDSNNMNEFVKDLEDVSEFMHSLMGGLF